MVTLTEVYQLNERADFQYVASELVKYYNLKTKVKFSSGAGVRGHYIPEKDIMIIRPSYPTVKEFIISVLHEIKHALDAKKMGKKRYSKRYNQAGTMAVHQGQDPYWDNKWEIRAERWGQNEYRKFWKNKF